MANIIFITQAVDQSDPVLATTVRWLEELAKQPTLDKITVLTLRQGRFSLPAKVEVITFKKAGPLPSLVSFYRQVWRRLKETDFFFIHMGGPYPFLLLPFRLFWGKPIYQWKTHTYVSSIMKFYALVCDTKIFTATPHSFPMKLKKVKPIGHGVDTELFNIKNIAKDREIVAVGRVTPVKHLEKTLKILGDYHLDNYGPTFSSDLPYRQKLGNRINFQEPVLQTALPDILNRYRCSISFNAGGLDKAVVEAMACGLPVLTDNVCVADILPPQLRELLILPEDDIKQQRLMIEKIMGLPDEELRRLGRELRQIVVANHSVEGLIKKIMTEIFPRVVVAFHEVSDRNLFQKRLLWLKKNQPNLLVTFDDGYGNWLENAVPVLEELKTPAIFFVCSGWLGLEEKAGTEFRQKNLLRQTPLAPLSITQLKALAAHPLFEIGSHTVHHLDLGQDWPEEVLEKEISGDKIALEEIIGQPVRWFAYPFGRSHNISSAATVAVKKAGFQGAFTFMPGYWQSDGDQFLIGRYGFDINRPLWQWRLRLLRR